MTRLLVLAIVVAAVCWTAAARASSPAPDPDPSAYVGGWVQVRQPRPWWTDPVRLPGRPGWWRCRVTAAPTMRCVRVR